MIKNLIQTKAPGLVRDPNNKALLSNDYLEKRKRQEEISRKAKEIKDIESLKKEVKDLMARVQKLEDQLADSKSNK